MGQRLYWRGVTFRNLLHSVFLCGDLVMIWTKEQKIAAIEECILESKDEIAYAETHGLDRLAADATQVLIEANRQLNALKTGAA